MLSIALFFSTYNFFQSDVIHEFHYYVIYTIIGVLE